MKAIVKYFPFLFLSVMGAAGAPASAAPDSMSASTAVSVFRRLEQFYTDMAAEKLDAAMTLYTPDAEVILPGQPPVVGASAIRRWWTATLSEYDFRVSPELVEATDLGDGVVLRGRAVGQLVPKKGGPAIDIDSWFVQIYRRQADGHYLFWRGASGPSPTK